MRVSTAVAGAAFAAGKSTLAELAAHASKVGEPTQRSGRQEAYENLINQYLMR